MPVNEVVIQVEVDADTLDARDVETNKNTQVIIGATIGVVILLGVCFLGYSLRSYMNADRLEQEKVHEIQKEVQMARARKAVAKPNVDDVDAVIDQFRTNETEQKLKTDPNADDDGAALEEQYNPLHDFAVFGVGNARIGGNQTLQQKMNLADEKSSVSESDENASEAQNDDSDKNDKVKETQIDHDERSELASRGSQQDSHLRMPVDSQVPSSRASAPVKGTIQVITAKKGLEEDAEYAEDELDSNY